MVCQASLSSTSASLVSHSHSSANFAKLLRGPKDLMHVWYMMNPEVSSAVCSDSCWQVMSAISFCL